MYAEMMLFFIRCVLTGNGAYNDPRGRDGGGGGCGGGAGGCGAGGCGGGGCGGGVIPSTVCHRK